MTYNNATRVMQLSGNVRGAIAASDISGGGNAAAGTK
jgi:lipopolysaccharide export system protein LptC